MSTLYSYLLNILHNYPFASRNSTTFAKNPIARALRNGLKDLNSNEQHRALYLYDSHGSPGIGRWSLIPWVGIFNQSITNSAKHGIYIVYLFSSDGSEIYLSLNLGCKGFYNQYSTRIAQKKIKETALKIRKLVSLKGSVNSNNRVGTKIDLKIGNKKKYPLAFGYELGNIISIKCAYPFTKDHNFLYSNQALHAGISTMKGTLYRIYPYLNFQKNYPKINKKGYSIIQNDSSSNYNDLVSSSNNTFNNASNNIHNVSKRNSTKQTKKRKVGIKNVILQRTSFPNKAPKLSNHKSPNNKGHLAKQDYEKSEKRKKNVGNYGEEMVMLSEYNKLIKANQKELAERIDHVSNKHDDYGYDIQSFDTKGRKIYIEVKSTTNINDVPFNISNNELYTSDEKYNKGELYIIYRLYNINITSDKDYIPPHYMIYGDSTPISKKLKMVPVSYSATFKQQ